MGFGSIVGALAGPVLGGILGGGGDDAAEAQAAATKEGIKLQKEMYDQNRADLAPYRDVGNAALYRLGTLLGIHMPGVPDREDLMKEMTAQYTTGGSQPFKVLPDGSKVYKNDIGKYTVDADGNFVGGRKKAFSAGGGPGTTDFSALNAAVDAKLAQLSKPPDDYGSLMEDFGMDDFERDPGYEFRRAEGEKSLSRSLAANGGLLSGDAMKAMERYGQDYASNEYGIARDRYNQDRSTKFNMLSGTSNYGMNAANTGVNIATNYANNVSSLHQDIGNARANAEMNSSNRMNQTMAGLGSAMSQYLPMMF